MNLWALALGVLLWFTNGITYSLVHTSILHGRSNPLPWNILHMLMLTGSVYCIFYSLLGVTIGCFTTIGFLLAYSRERFIHENFEH